MLSTSPGLLLISVFTPFTISCKTLNDKKYLFICKKWTVINFVLSIIFYLCGSCFLIFYYLPSSVSHCSELFKDHRRYPSPNLLSIITLIDEKDWNDWNESIGIPSLLFNLKICLPLFLLSIICYALLLKCKIRGQSLYKTTAMNVDDWNDIIDLDNLRDEGDLEMGVLKTKKAFIDPSTLPYSPRIICIPKPFEV